MKTLTLFEYVQMAYLEYENARDDHFAALMQDNKPEYRLLNERRIRRHRQLENLKQALTKRLQEQEERDKKIEKLVLAYNQLEEKGSALQSRWIANEGEDSFDWGIIETMSKYRGETFKFCDVCIEVIGTLKENNDAELIQSNSNKTNEEGINRGSQDSQ